MGTRYEVKYYRNDGSFGAYCGDSIEAFFTEIKMCERCGYKYKAIVDNGYDEYDRFSNSNKEEMEIYVNRNKYCLSKNIYIENKKRFMNTLGHTFVWDCDCEVWRYYNN